MNAVQQARKLFNCKTQDKAMPIASELIKSGRFLVRMAPHDQIETIIYTTLEPCPMCTVGSVINTKLSKVVIATPSYLLPQLQLLLNSLFFDTKEPLDRSLGKAGFLRYNPAVICAIAQTLINSENTR